MPVTITPVAASTATTEVRTMRTGAKPAEAPKAPVEAAAPTTPPTTPETKAPVEPGLTSTQAPNEPKLAFLARQEKALQKKRDELKAEREGLEKQRSELLNGKFSKTDLDIDFYGTMAKLGYDGQKLQERLLQQQGESDAVKAVRSEMEALKAQLAEKETKQTETTRQQYEQSMGQYKDAAKKLTQESPDDFEIIKTFGREGAVADRIESHYYETGILLDVSEAAKMVEDELLADALEMVKLKKVQAKLKPITEEPVHKQDATGPKTLTHNNTTTPSGKKETFEERKRRLVAEMRAKAFQS